MHQHSDKDNDLLGAEGASTDVRVACWRGTDGEERRVLVCRDCRSGLRPGSGIETHLRQVHRRKGSILRRAIECSWLAEPLSDPRSVELPGDGQPAVPCLPILAGYSCVRCRFLTINRKVIQAHHRKAGHQPPGPGTGPAGWTEVRLQTLSGGSSARYWIVKQAEHDSVATTAGRPGTSGSGSGLASMLEARLARYEESLAAELEETRRTADSRQGADFESTWVREMGWARHLSGSDPGEHY
ncbi:uncharacterized protein B0I36DRAFT_278595, partial [Microdochium trichocladiopsis]